MLELLSDVCQLSEEEKLAWSKLFDEVYSWMFGFLGDHTKGDAEESNGDADDYS